MKKFFAFFVLCGALSLSTIPAFAQDATDVSEPATEQVAEQPADQAVEMTDEVAVAAAEQEVPIHQQLKTKFIEGGPGFMASVILCLILGLALAIERIIYLNLASTNTEKLLLNIEEALKSGGVEAAKEVCRNTRGPVASIFYQGLDRAHEGIDVVEKSVVSYGGVQTAQLESGLSWISLFISIAPMLGFLGTVIGMVEAFDAIQAAGDISPTVVAAGIKVALITTIAGLIVAIILQIFYNYLLNKIDSITLGMEDASISLIDILVKHNLNTKA